MVEVHSSSPEETERVAAALARGLRAGDVVTVSGELGAGKTTFVRGAARALGVEAPVTSPTYTIGNRYSGHVAVSHLDLYRFDRFDDEEWGDVERLFEDAVVFVEWPDAAEGRLPAVRAAVGLRHQGRESRLIVVSSPEKSLEISVSTSARSRI